MLVKVLKDKNEDGSPVFMEGYKVGDVVDISHVADLIREGKVAAVEAEEPKEEVEEPKVEEEPKKKVRKARKKK